MKEINASELILDYGLYPRHSVDSQHVHYIIEAMAAGMEMPPIIVDKKTKKVVDGFHRVTAALRIAKSDATVMVIEKAYKNEKAVFDDAMRLNSSHGRMMTKFDRMRCILVAEGLGIAMDQVASALSMTMEAVGQLTKQRAGKLRKALPGSKGKFHNVVVPIKRTIQHKAGRQLTKGQVEANDKLSGMSQLFYANQLIVLIENDLLDTENKNLMVGLVRLRDLIDSVIEDQGSMVAEG